jgi:hypothetical protein
MTVGTLTTHGRRLLEHDARGFLLILKSVGGLKIALVLQPHLVILLPLLLVVVLIGLF